MRGMLFLVVTLLVACPASDPPALPGKPVLESPSPSVLACLSTHPQPAQANANADTRRLFAWLSALPSQGENRVVSGQFLGSGSAADFDEPEQIEQQTGHWLGMVGADFAESHDTVLDAVPWLVRYWLDGGLVTVSHHALNPQTREFGSVTSRDVDIADLLKEGTKARTNWLADLDKVAEGLRQMREHGVVVLWRPFHEMNGDYFWWGKRDKETFKAVWREMFRYLSVEKSLDNLLWVYSPKDDQGEHADYYPGDDVVDIVGFDAYHTDLDGMQGYEALEALGKPMALTEYGPDGALVIVPIIQPNIDYSELITSIRAKFPKLTYWFSWSGPWGMQAHRNVDTLLDDPWVANRPDVTFRTICPRE